MPRIAPGLFFFHILYYIIFIGLLFNKNLDCQHEMKVPCCIYLAGYILNYHQYKFYIVFRDQNNLLLLPFLQISL